MSKIEIHSKESNFPIYKVTNEDTIINFSKETKKITTKQVPKVPGASVHLNLLTEEECKQFIKITEEMGYEDAPISTFSGMVLDTDFRNNKRVIWQLKENNKLMETIYQRIKKEIPKELKLHNTTYVPVGLNERLRFYRYKGDEIFNLHYDGCFPRNSKELSILTFIIYLNEDFEGGHTTFVNRKEQELAKVKPVTGSCLMFCHGSHEDSPLHEGSKCSKGTKYVLRSDVMFQKK
jgi:prolyl 4-hydroxylase